jgi:phage baseplate assembly protein gpV
MPEDARAGIRPHVEVDGTPLPSTLDVLLEQTVVDDHRHLPDMFLLCFHDQGHDVVKQAHIKIGSKIKISAPDPAKGGSELLIDGEVTALEAEYGAAGSRAIVRGYDASHRLHRGRVTQSYRNVKDSDLARTIAQRAGLGAGTIDDSKTTYDHVTQANLSDWDFLKSRAAEIGYEVAVAGAKLDFKRPTPSEQGPGQGDLRSKDPLQLTFGTDLLEFRPRVTSSEQAGEIQVRGWDYTAKRALIASTPAGTSSVQLPQAPSVLAGTFGGPPFRVTDRPLSTQSDVDAVARSTAEQLGGAAAEAEGVARGNPKLRAGAPVSVAAVAADFAGRYTLTHTRHVFDSRGYRTSFEVSGRQDRSMLGLVTQGGPNGGASAGGPPQSGVVTALVTNNDDPKKWGRVKLKFPWMADDFESDWVRMLQVGAGPDSGASMMPEVNDEVLVAFVQGEVRQPVVIGALHNGKDKPPLVDGLFDNGRVKRRGFVSRRGHRFVFVDDPGKPGIEIHTGDQKLKIELDEAKGEIRISCKGKVAIEADGGELSLKGQTVTVEAQTQLKLKGQAVEVTGNPIKLN